MKLNLWRVIYTVLFASLLVLGGCSGDDGKDGAQGPAGPAGVAGPQGPAGADGTDGEDATADPIADIGPESCAVCHKGAGEEHQMAYDDYNDASELALAITSVVSTPNADGVTFTTVVTFTIMQNGLPFVDADKLPSLNQKTFYAVTYDSATRMYLNSTSFSSSNIVSAGGGTYTITNTGMSFAPEQTNAQVYAYIAEGVLDTEGMTLYGNVANTGMAFGDAASYQSVANESSCTNCHGTPYMKHGYRAAAVENLADFAACKSCHYDNRNGGHQDWQLLVDDVVRFAEIWPEHVAGNCGRSPAGCMTADEKAQYAYTANVMNDVHMSHAMEFPYPQSMMNCATCHEGKLAMTTTDANFTATTCKSCHPVTAPDGTESNRAPSMMALWEETGTDSFHNMDLTCNECHKAGGVGPTFAALHTGYNPEIYADAAGTRYSDVFAASVDSATLTGNTLNVKFSATGTAGGLNAADITPTLMVGLYGYGTKDYIVSPHGRDVDSTRNLEWAVGSENPRFTLISAANGMWEADVDLSFWEGMLADGSVERAEIAVMPQLKDADGMTVALDAPSRTFDLTMNAFDDAFFDDIVNVDGGCNDCHDALATTFHSGNRGGNIVVCRLCHVPSNGGSHLEMQSRSIDSYVHAIHSFQAFDVGRNGGPDFTDPVDTMFYQLHIEHVYPNFTIKNCESCHNDGTYDVPDQAKSLPGVFSAANDTLANGGWDRNIGAVPSYVAGPASRACGACHRAEYIKEDEAGALAAFNQHTKAGGYLIEADDGVYEAVVAKIMAMFE